MLPGHYDIGPSILKEMQGDLQTANGENRNSGSDQDFAQPERFVGRDFGAAAVVSSASPPRPRARLIVADRRGGRLRGPACRGDEILPLGRADEVGRRRRSLSLRRRSRWRWRLLVAWLCRNLGDRLRRNLTARRAQRRIVNVALDHRQT